ncbi:MAG: hypothetical protein U1F43_37870 [Myxococcota bacterium]
MLDNVVTPFGGGTLDRALTAQDTVELRVLGKSEVPTLRWRALVIATGNNVEVKGDTTRRVVVSRLEPKIDSPEDRTDFRHPDLIGWLRGERSRLVAAALTLLRAWHLAGAPVGTCRTWGSFEAWARIIPPALVWAGGADPMGARIGSDAEDSERLALVGLLDGIERLAPPSGVTARTLVEMLYPPARLLGTAAPDAFDGVREAIEMMVPTPAGKAPSTDRLGRALRSRKGRFVGGRFLEASPGHGGLMLWRVGRGGPS